MAFEQGRQKFGLNKIDETSSSATVAPEQKPCINGVAQNHRRTESLSCEFDRRHFITNNDKLTNNIHPLMTASGLSPDVQRRLVLHNFRAMECKATICCTFLA